MCHVCQWRKMRWLWVRCNIVCYIESLIKTEKETTTFIMFYLINYFYYFMRYYNIMVFTILLINVKKLT